jgi:hypothetical protein
MPTSSVKHRDDFETMAGSGGCNWTLEEHPAPAGTFASIEPDSERTLLNRSPGPVTALLFGAIPGPGYSPPSWA